ncbi:hypothetical protein COCSUDRAFT_33907 [Coccomyxa subellipsoidea C-169]|uniref:Uncharacterized protein n=1 Tax=Coccomyxa subellipsoidea (strain C-169) TaxID=574566 RepID=I0YR11_COCSC|nr:hypothetical protein COCSUDRAFT_33907 [Coccomyxa subellipsoidea C-169]EIE20830.1 hypothetical protein COCSUDRAFT_33907 [Coccomyxa subellipsoidea C-169]|eukprot:XP_005645374.1 hypothetical protein COCSUDRAFT_33907 [Coccomyxa subellipsoidea C-169]
MDDSESFSENQAAGFQRSITNTEEDIVTNIGSVNEAGVNYNLKPISAYLVL